MLGLETALLAWLLVGSLAHSWNHRFVTLNSTLEMHFVEAGDTTNPTVVLLHGFPEFWYSWRFQIPVLAQSYHVIAPDMRGYGQTDHPSHVDEYHISFLVQDVVQLLDALQIEKAHIVGHDWGAVVAWSAAFLHESRFLSVTGASVPYNAYTETLDPMVKLYSEEFYINRFQECGAAEKVLSDPYHLFKAIFMAPPPPPGENTDGESEAVLLSTFSEATEGAKKYPQFFVENENFNEKDLALYTRTFKKSGFVGPLNYYRNWDQNAAYLASTAANRKQGYDINIPSLTITATRDIKFLRNSRHVEDPALKNRYPTASLDCGHFMQQQQHAGFTKAILEFWEKIGEGGTEHKEL